MPKRKPYATVGAVEHGNSFVVVTLDPEGRLLDRRRFDLTQGLPTHPHHHQGSWAVGRYLDSPWAKATTLEEALALVETVREAAAVGARRHLETLAREVTLPISTLALRTCPTLPPTVEERIRDNRAQTVADTVLYREALASAATELGWATRWYDKDRVNEEARAALGRDLKTFISAMGKAVGPPWRAEHKLAAAAALACREEKS